ncbi:hypothetical protein [Sphaerisporangium fuscum]|uniref:hypothetical protein n=1 Tax=Sphaerisporangium fuscum TaxID=2835868 RepID=UPI001BDD0C27|nr:hypothetical protein [Sphaerisporangium fuscum]
MSTEILSRPENPDEKRDPGGRVAGRLTRAWLPAAFATAVAVALPAAFGAPVADIARFGLYVALGLALPGTLLIRAVYRGRRTLAEEVALGLALGYAVEVLTYIAARAAGAPRLVLVWPAATYVAFLAVPRLRRHWRSPARVRSPAWVPWTLALAFAGLLTWSGVPYFRNNGLTWPALGAAGYDVPFHLALAGELKHHMPPQMPTVAGEPLLYHWFAYAHIAAASWITGVEPVVLVFRLAMLPMLAAFLVLIAMTARRVTGSWRGTAPVLAGTVFVGTPNLYLSSNLVFGWNGLQYTAWRSPTQTFGALLFAPVVIVLLDLLVPAVAARGSGRRLPSRRGLWTLLAVFLVAVMGAKAVYLPLLLVGVAAVVVVKAATGRRPLWPGAAVLAMTLACLAYAQLVLFGQARQGMILAPLSAMRERWELLAGVRPGVPAAAVAGMTVLLVLCMAAAWCGTAGLLSDRRLPARPAVVLMLGMAVAGHAVTLLCQHVAFSQFLFLDGAYPYLVIVTVYGALLLWRRAHLPALAAAGAVAAAVLLTCAVAVACGVTVPLDPARPFAVLYLPYVIVVILVLLAGAVLWVTLGRPRAAAVLTAALTGIGLLACGSSLLLWLPGKAVAKGIGDVGRTPAGESQAVPRGALTAARWLRDHSDPGDVVATGTHCRWGRENPCDAGQFFAAGLSERRVLVEGWLYTYRANDAWRPGMVYERIPYWDPERLRLNDSAINAPTTASIALLRDRYHVRWLLVDERRLAPGSRLGDFATLGFRSGDYAVYRIPDRS